MPTTSKTELSIREQIEEVDAKLVEANDKWVSQGSDVRLPLYNRTINGLLDRRARLMEKRDGRKLLMP